MNRRWLPPWARHSRLPATLGFALLFTAVGSLAAAADEQHGEGDVRVEVVITPAGGQHSGPVTPTLGGPTPTPTVSTPGDGELVFTGWSGGGTILAVLAALATGAALAILSRRAPKHARHARHALPGSQHSP
jgi:hypothetical protein